MASKIRQLVMRLEYVDALKLAHPFIKGFDVVYYCLSEEEAQSVSRGEISDAVAARKKEDVADKEGVISVHTTSFFIGLSIKPKEGSYPCQGQMMTDSSVLTHWYSKRAQLDLADSTSRTLQQSLSRWPKCGRSTTSPQCTLRSDTSSSSYITHFW